MRLSIYRRAESLTPEEPLEKARSQLPPTVSTRSSGFWVLFFSVVVFIPQSVKFYQTFCFLNMLLLKSFLKEPTLESKRKLPKI